MKHTASGILAGNDDTKVLIIPVFVLLGAALVILVSGMNQPLFISWHQAGTHFPPRLWASITFMGDVLPVIVCFLPFARKYPQVLWAAVLAAILGVAFTHTLKPLLDLPRPPGVLPAEELTIIGPSIRSHAFPSGHTLTAFVAAGVWAVSIKNTALRIALFGMASLVGLSRVMVGVHWPLDILVGATGGWIAAWLGVLWAQRWQWGVSIWGRRILTTALWISAIFLFWHDGRYPQAQWLAWLIASIGTVTGGIYLIDLFRNPAKYSQP
jgi:membrane-associated phospholipid phosphatase